MKIFRLQPLRITSGWTVVYNNFSEYDPETDSRKGSLELCEDLLQLQNHNLLVDLGWYGDFDNGQYIMYMVDNTLENPFDKPFEKLETRSKKEVLYYLEYWTDYNHYYNYLKGEV
ncbi:MAG: hypothetical protein K2L10_03865 [Ruminococcus sp.]|nr:hypothetical protein [Ruminococcus sp.]